MIPPCSICALFLSLLLAIRKTNEPFIWQHLLQDRPFGGFVSDSCMCIVCDYGSHQQDGDKAGRKIRLIGTRSIAQLKCLDRSLYVGLDIAKGVHHLFSKSVDMMFTSTFRVNFFWKNTQTHDDKYIRRYYKKNLLEF